MPSKPSRVFAALARNRVNLSPKTFALCFHASLYLHADPASLVSREMQS